MSEDNNLIKTLTEEHSVMNKSLSIGRRFLIWILCITLYSGLGFVFDFVRSDILDAMLNVEFFLATFSLLGVAVSSTYLCMLLSVPGSSSKITLKLALICIVLWFLSLCTAFLVQNDPFAHINFAASIHCTKSLIAFSILPGVALFALMRLAAVQNSQLSSFLLFVSSGFLAAFYLQVSCSADGPVHILMYHILPVLLLGGAGILLARKLFR